MSKVLHIIDYEHLMDYDQYRRFENMIEFDMKEVWDEEEGRFKSYVNPDGPMAQAGFLEDEPSKVDYDDIPF